MNRPVILNMQCSPKNLLFGSAPRQQPSMVLEQTRIGVNPKPPGKVLNQKILPLREAHGMIYGEID